MKIIVVGTGYVGLVTGACLADVGISVTCVDINQEKIKALKKGEIPIYEPGLDKIVERNIKAQRLNFTTHLSENIQDANAIFIAVGTPPDKEGNADLQYVKAVAKEIGENMQDYLVVVTKSTVPVGTSQLIKKTIEEQLEKRNSPIEFDVASNPEFLKEGAAIDDFMKPDRVVIGVENDRAKNMLEKIYKPFQLNGYRIIYMDVTSAELTKYTANAMLATRISFMNDIANICEKVGANINQIRAGIGADPRIGKKFLYAGLGYGGSCFPKDVKALIKTGEELNHPLRILQAVDDVNQDQKRVLFHKISKAFKNLKGKTIAVWGLSFKPNTDDLREAPAIDLIHDLVKSGVRVRAVDPVAAHEAKKILPAEVEYCEDVYTSAQGADAIALVTEWNQFRFPNWGKLKKMMNDSHIFDGRNIYDLELIESKGFTYHGIGL